MSYEDPELRRDRRLAKIRAQRGTPERQAEIEAIQRRKTEGQRRTSASPNGRRSPENSPDMFGHPWPTWFAMREAGLEHLTTCASDRRLTSYKELWDAIERSLDQDLGNHWRQLPVLLGYMSVQALSEYDLIPTALVVAPDENNEPGPGFFRIAADLGLLAEADAPPIGEDWTMSDTQRTFWEATVEGMYDRFASPS